MIKLLAIALAGAALTPLGATTSQAASPQHRPAHAVKTGTATFRLTVAGTPARGATFWVSYGPLAGRFGVIQLHSAGNHVYSGRADLPLAEAGTFTYLEAQGTEMVHGLPQPGGIPIVIRNMSSVTAVTVSQRTVHWSVPLG